MAATYSPNDAFDFVKQMVKNMPLERVRVRILDDTLKMLWMAAPWRWTIGTISPVTLTSNVQDNTIATLPVDFLYAISCTLTDGADKVPVHLRISPMLPLGGILGYPKEAAITGTPGAAGNLRLYPAPGALPANLQALVNYKRTAPIITPANVDTSGEIVMDDEWFWVYVSGVLWQAYLYGDDQRAGGVQYTEGKAQFTGQRGVFEANIQLMREREKLLLMDEDRSTPDQPRSK